MGLVTTSFTLFLEFVALQNVSASLAALIYTAEPLWVGPGQCCSPRHRMHFEPPLMKLTCILCMTWRSNIRQDEKTCILLV